MKKIALIITALLFVGIAFAQEDGSTLDQPVRRPVEYPWQNMETDTFSVPVAPVFVRHADVMYYHTVWRIIDLREKRNHPYYFPTLARGTWKSLAQTIFDAIDIDKTDRANRLSVYDDEFCTREKSLDDIRATLAEPKMQHERDPETGEIINSIPFFEPFTADQILSYRIREVWFFDKQRSVMEVRILSIEPIIEYVREVNVGDGGGNEEDNILGGEPITRSGGHILWEELRPYLKQQEMFNIKNNAARISFDDAMTWKRQFATVIYQEQNVYGDREIQQYIKNSRDQRIESERINEKIRNFEHELWEF